MSEGNAKRDWNKVQRRNNRRLSIRVSEEHEAEITARAARANVSVSAYMKAAALSQPLPPPTSRPFSTDRALALKILAELGKLGSNANQTARANNVLARMIAAEGMANVGHVQEAIQDGRQSLAEINTTLTEYRNAILHKLGFELK
jgi:hypothetical protein